MRMRGIFWHVLFIPPVTIVSCDVTILRDASISFSPCSRAVLISLMDSRVEVSSSSLMQMSILKSYQLGVSFSIHLAFSSALPRMQQPVAIA